MPTKLNRSGKQQEYDKATGRYGKSKISIIDKPTNVSVKNNNSPTFFNADEINKSNGTIKSEDITNNFNLLSDEFKEIYNDVITKNGITITSGNPQYNPDKKTINITNDGLKEMGNTDAFINGEVLAHELGHALDNCYNDISITYKIGGKTLKDVIKEELDNTNLDGVESMLFDKLQIFINNGESIYASQCKIVKDYNCVIDILSSRGYNYFGFGHIEDYWKDDNNMAKEFFAQCCASKSLSKKEYDNIKSIFPKSFNHFEQLIKVIERR